MPAVPERSPRERETLIFSTPEAAQEFSQQVQEKLRQPQTPGVNEQRERVGEAVAGQFVQHGESVAALRQPWEHSHAEHAEVQQLVDMAFAKDLPTALRQARTSAHYPRNLDLFHDVLTSELYDLVREQHINQQPLLGSMIATIGLLIAIGVLMAVVFTI